jgi:hypothetical protein
MVGIKMRSIGKEMEWEFKSKANAPSLVLSKSVFALVGSLPFRSTCDLILGIKKYKKPFPSRAFILKFGLL